MTGMTRKQGKCEAGLSEADEQALRELTERARRTSASKTRRVRMTGKDLSS